MNDIIPAIIPKSLADLEVTTAAVSFASRIQIDVVDGVFAPSVSWPYEPVGEVADASAVCARTRVMVDIMATDQLSAMRAWLMAGAKDVVVHIEAVTDWSALVALKHKYNCALYVAADDETPIATYQTTASDIDGWQVMGIDQVGAQGEPFSPRALENIKALKKSTPELPIVVDGSVNEQTLPILKQAGADAFVVGSAIMAAADKQAAYQALQSV